MLARMPQIRRPVVHRRLPWTAAPETVLRALAGEDLPVMVPTGRGPSIVAARPSTVAVGTDVWEALDIPCSPHTVHPTGFAGGWLGLLADGIAGSVEVLPAAPPDPGGPPPAIVGRYPTLAIVTPAGEITIASTDGVAALDRFERDLTARVAALPARDLPEAPPVGAVITSSLTARDYRAAVDRIREYIRNGDCYQVNLTQRLVAPWDGTPIAFADRLWAAAGPSSHRAYLGLREGTVVSASPELLVRVRGQVAESEPIKGTAPVGEWLRLRASVKDRSEHVMIVDLIRNDLGRVAVAGGVSVPRLFDRLRTPYVEHMVSTVRATLADDVTVTGVLRAVFPGGSVTGTPKVRSLEIIRELEPVSRGPAFGSMIAVSPAGDIEASVAIRTAWVTGSEVRYWCGGAVVWDSDPDAELTEALAKATPFLRALEVRWDG